MSPKLSPVQRRAVEPLRAAGPEGAFLAVRGRSQQYRAVIRALYRHQIIVPASRKDEWVDSQLRRYVLTDAGRAALEAT